jgi:xylan 1,4-beta-xylosidase
MKHTIIVTIMMFLLIGCGTESQNDTVSLHTISNPVNISYRFAIEEPSRREAADPTIVWFKDRYFLFASKSGGYWHSQDLANWTFLETSQIPTEEYAPTAIAVGDTLYFLGSSTELSTIYMSTDPLAGEWTVAVAELEIPVWDPAFYLDEDNRMYLYWGCSDSRPLYGVEVDYKNGFAFVGETKELMHANPKEYGWEVPGDYNTLINQSPWIEGAWMTKRNGKYYLQYSGPGTEYKSYADAVYVSDNPLGPFELQPHNPFVYKPEGFAAGAGHGSLFTDQYGNAWHIGTITISQKHVFERRLGLYPAFYDEDGTLYSITKYGDYPLIMPKKKINSFEDIFPGWMMLSYGKTVEVSSSIDTLPAKNMADEDIRTYWAAKSGGSDEFAIMDLGEKYNVHAIQINFAEHNTTLMGRKKNLFHRYVIEYSNDGSNWNLLVDKSKNDTDNTHDYVQLDKAVSCRYLKIDNVEVPDGHFALSGFRVFGKGNGDKPEMANHLVATRGADKRSVSLTWEKSPNATGYNISFGSDKNKLYHNYMVYADTTVTINSLNVNQDYFFTIEAFNENGITVSEEIVTAERVTTMR